MELNKDYSINIVGSLKTGSFVIAPKLNEDTSDNSVNYRKHLLDFNSCSETSEWFEKLDCPQVEIGKAVIVKLSETTNEWARGIIAKYNKENLNYEIYLIDTQILIKNYKHYDLRICPSKFLQLKLPTYAIHIDVDFSLNDDDVKYVIELMINNNQYGELNIVFTPQSIQNYEYSGVLTVNNLPLKKYLKILLKQYSSKKNYKLSVFDPLQFCHLKNIFIPSHSSNLVFLDKRLISSLSDLTNLNDLAENLSYDPLDEDSSTIDYSEDFSDDSSLTQGSSNTNSVVKKNIYSLSDLEINSPNCLSANRQTECMSQSNEKHQVSINLETTVDNMDKNKSNTINIENGDQDINKKEEPFINQLMKKRSRVFKKIDNKCQQNENITNISNVIETSVIPLCDESKISNVLEISQVSLSDSNIIWSSDEES